MGIVDEAEVAPGPEAERAPDIAMSRAVGSGGEVRKEQGSTSPRG